jgi:hypothetical protein
MAVVPKRLKSSTIERRASVLLVKFQLAMCNAPGIGAGSFRFPRIPKPPVPIEEILEQYLRLHLEFDNIHERLGLDQVDGATVAETRQVFVDERLDPIEHPELEGRYRFTVAHEIGHWQMHREVRDLHLLGQGRNPAAVGSYREFEWQADKFASYLLMPEHLVRRQWKAVFGQEDPLILKTDVAAMGASNLGSRAEFVEAFANHHSESLASEFKVSVTAMRIRLQELGLLPRA